MSSPRRFVRAPNIRQTPTPPSKGGFSFSNLVGCLQLRVLGFGLLQDGDVWIGVLPEGEEVFVGSKRPNAGAIGIRPLRGSRLQGVRTSHSQRRQRSRPAVPDDAAVVGAFLELGGSFCALSGCQVCLAANVSGIETREVC